MAETSIITVNEIVSMFETRDNTYKQVTAEIANKLQPAFAAMQEFMHVSHESITIVDFNSTELNLNVVLFVTTEEESESEILERLSPSPDGTIVTQRMVRFRIPLEIAVKSKEEIVDYLVQQLVFFNQAQEDQIEPENNKSTREQRKKETAVEKEFDTVDLTTEQKNQLMWLQHTSKGKH